MYIVQLHIEQLQFTSMHTASSTHESKASLFETFHDQLHSLL